MRSLLPKSFPSHWKKCNISKIVFFQEGPGVRKSQFTKEGVKLLNVGNINNNELDLSTTSLYISDEEAKGKYNHFLVDEGDLLIACSGIAVDNFSNKIAFVKKEHLPLCMNTSTMRFKVLNKDELSIHFFYRYLQTNSFNDQLRKLITGSAQLNFGPSHIKRIEIPLPPLPEQKRIATILDKADALHKKSKQQLAAYDELLQAVFLDMFGDPVTNPKGWEKNVIDNLCKVQGGIQLTSRRNNLEKKVPYLRVANVYRNKLELSEIKEMGVTEIEYKKTLLKVNDILIVEGHGNKNEIGRCAIWDGSIDGCIHQNHLIRIRVNSKTITPLFLSYFINSEGGRNQMFKTSNTTSGLNTISTGKVKKIISPLPPITLQNKFARIVENIEAQKTLLKQSMQESKDLFNGLVQTAFTKGF